MFIEECDGKKVIGRIEFNQASDELEIIDLTVSPDRRRQGVATHLFRAMLEANPLSRKIFLEVRAGNGPARAFYEKLGFHQIAVRPKYYSDGEDAVVMVSTDPSTSSGRTGPVHGEPVEP